MPGRKPTGKPNGRPPKTVDWEEFDKLCALQCTLKEFEYFFEMDDKTLDALCLREKGMGFSDYFELKRQAGKISLRRRMFQLAQKDDKTMLIWLTKQKAFLGYSDRIDAKVKHSGKVGGKLTDEELEERTQKMLARIAGRKTGCEE